VRFLLLIIALLSTLVPAKAQAKEEAKALWEKEMVAILSMKSNSYYVIKENISGEKKKALFLLNSALAIRNNAEIKARRWLDSALLESYNGKWESEILFHTGLFFDGVGLLDSAQKCFTRSEELFREQERSLWEAYSIMHSGIEFSKAGESKQSMLQMEKAHTLFKELQNDV